MEKLGRVGYEAYNAHQGGKNYRGEPIPTWEENQRADIKVAWDHASEKIVDEVVSTIEKQLGSRGLLGREVQGTLDSIRRLYGQARGVRPAITYSGDSG